MKETAPVNAPLGYFDQQVLAAYRNEADKWHVETDFFEGRVKVRGDYYEGLDEASRDECYIDVGFGFRTMVNGDLAVAAWLPDLVDKSKGHLNRWRGFVLANPQWALEDDRFELWKRRYLQGDWHVEDGVRAQLSDVIQTARGLTGAVLGVPLFKHEIPASMSFPSAQNTHRYQDAHANLYPYLIDGIQKACLKALAIHLGASVNIDSSKTVAALKALLPQLDPTGSFNRAVELVSAQRRLAGHEVRPPAQAFRAFEQFTEDLQLVVSGLCELVGALEAACGADAQRATRRWHAMSQMPKIARPSESHYSICQAALMRGKTVDKVEYGFREDIPGVHQSELVILHFTDGSIASIHTGSNARNIADRHSGVEPDEFHVSFHVHWVPSLSKGQGNTK